MRPGRPAEKIAGRERPGEVGNVKLTHETDNLERF
jgi:hypothetical protein